MESQCEDTATWAHEKTRSGPQEYQYTFPQVHAAVRPSGKDSSRKSTGCGQVYRGSTPVQQKPGLASPITVPSGTRDSRYPSISFSLLGLEVPTWTAQVFNFALWALFTGLGPLLYFLVHGPRGNGRTEGILGERQ